MGIGKQLTAMPFKVVASLTLAATSTGCESNEQLWTESEIRQIAEDVSLSNAEVIDHNAREANALSDRVEQLETDKESLQDEVDRLERRVDSLESQMLWVR